MRVATLIVFALLLPGTPAPEQAPRSPLTLVADAAGEHLYVADATRREVIVLSIPGRAVIRRIALPEAPNGLALAPGGRLLYVTGASADGHVHEIDLDLGVLVRSIPVGHLPCAPVMSPDGATLYFCNRFLHSVAALDVATGSVRRRVSAPREPIAAALSPDGAMLVVGNHLPLGPADGDDSATRVTLIDAEAMKVLAAIPLPNGSTSLRDVGIAPDGSHAFATHIVARFHAPTTQLERGWVNTNALSILDLEKRTLLATVLLDDVGHGAANPWGVCCTPDGQHLLVTHSGGHELSVIDLPGLLAKLATLDAGEVAAAADTPSFLGALRRRVPLAGEGPRGVTAAAGSAWTAEYFSGSVGSYPLPGDDYSKATSLSLGPQPPRSAIRRGELLFHDSRIGFQGWQSCTSCHPDCRADALNWDLLNDGFGNPKNTRSMLLAHRTPPAMSTGVRGDARAAVRAGIRHIQFAVRPESEAEDIDAFLDSLTPLASPLLAGGQLSQAAQRGAKLFEQARCATCHPAPLYTDLKSYEMGTGRGMDAGRPFDTPTLIEVWRTAPYLHDGRAPDLSSLFREHNPDDRHGLTRDLSPQQLDDLIAFVLTL